jgi:hypothetical protein
MNLSRWYGGELDFQHLTCQPECPRATYFQKSYVLYGATMARGCADLRMQRPIRAVFIAGNCRPPSDFPGRSVEQLCRLGMGRWALQARVRVCTLSPQCQWHRRDCGALAGPLVGCQCQRARRDLAAESKLRLGFKLTRSSNDSSLRRNDDSGHAARARLFKLCNEGWTIFEPPASSGFNHWHVPGPLRCRLSVGGGLCIAVIILCSLSLVSLARRPVRI